MSKKNLDKLFQEKFSEFSDVPTEKVWKSIEASLNKKKKNRKVIPIWWKLGGIAAVMAIGIYLTIPFNNDATGTDNIITDVENKKDKIEDDRSPIVNTPKIVEETNTEDVKNNTRERANQTDNPSHILNSKTTSESEEVWVQNNRTNRASQTEEATNVQIATNTKTHKNKVSDDSNRNIIKNHSVPDKAIAQQATPHDHSGKNQALALKSDGDNHIEDGTKPNEEAIAEVKKEDAFKENVENTKKSIFDEIEEKEVEVAEVQGSRWSAGPNIAPVYFDAMGSGSPVHSIFVPNSKSGDVNLSYGIAVAYEVSKKLSIKTGINKVEYGYNTNDIEFSSSLDGFGNGQIANIDYSSASKNIRVESNVNNASSFTGKTAFDAAAKTPILTGVMAQQFGYLEVPLELNYALIDKKFGVDLVGGLSSLFLIDNSVSLTSGELTTEMGEANNLNSINFSTNIGFGFNYKFTPKVQLNVEPIFKYQLNTFSDTSGDFRPFSIGVYSGLNFKF
ncbi:outer membrane beta-barrel protein [Maribacter luteus]|uniref:outer membrane beta-barrel protein n=1 Tax=Maribacter luteus TaxID=2594478 RepID=UPI002493067E|nr:outer membrane beta-barrel protein [Maribacter luteus]